MTASTASPAGKSSGPASTYRTHDIEVRGGTLRVGEWSPANGWASEAPVVLALHSLAGAHLVWSFLAAQLPGVRIIAPDLRGRGRSSDLPGPFGIDQHVNDVLAVMDALQLSDVTLVGHSLGAFVAVAALEARRCSFARAVLVDGGLPLTVPLVSNAGDLVEAILGRPAPGVELTFSSTAIHRRFWRLHPALGKSWSSGLDSYADYLVEETLGFGGEFEFRPVASVAAIEQDARELCGSVEVRRRLVGVADAVLLLTAPRGLLNEVPGVYTSRGLELALSGCPAIQHRQVEGVNHHTIVASRKGAAAIAVELTKCLAFGESRRAS